MKYRIREHPKNSFIVEFLSPGGELWLLIATALSSLKKAKEVLKTQQLQDNLNKYNKVVYEEEVS